jgi:epimerase transport system membrane fusion protein
MAEKGISMKLATAGSAPAPADAPPGAPAPAAPAAPAAPDQPSVGLGGVIVVGFIIIALFFGGIVGWAAFAPLGSAAIAPGVVIVDSKRKTIKHLEGGIVGEIMVRDGDVVTEGQVIVRLDDTQARASLELLRGRYRAASALLARLRAERDGMEAIIFPDALLERQEDPATREAMEGQTSIFNARREAIAGQVAILVQRVKQFEEEIVGLEGEISSQNTQLGLIGEEIHGVKTLVDKGLAQKPRLLALQREQAEIRGRRSQNQAAIARANQSIGEAELRMSELRTGMINEVVQELRDVETELYDMTERMRSAEDIMRRTDITAPIAGAIVGLQVNTLGGVISPGEPLMDIVPSGDMLIVEVHVDPGDIDVVHVGLEAQVRITAFRQRNLKPLDGVVTKVSADAITDERSGVSYYLAQIELVGDLAAALGGAVLHPGMPAETMIATGERTALDYFTKPFLLSFDRALRED